MYKSAEFIADYVLLKVAAVPPEIKPLVDRVAKQYAQYGVKPLSARELEKMFKGNWQKQHGTPSAQEVLLKSKWLRDANASKSNFSSFGSSRPASSPVSPPDGKGFSRKVRVPRYAKVLLKRFIPMGFVGGVLGVAKARKAYSDYQKAQERGRKTYAKRQRKNR